MPTADVILQPGVWKLLTESNVQKVRVKNKSASTAETQATAGEVALSSLSFAGSIPFLGGEGEIVDIPEWWRGTPGANRLYGYSSAGGTLSVSY